MIDYSSLSPTDSVKNLTLAFEVGSKVGIPILLEVEEVVDGEANEGSMLAYIAKYYWGLSFFFFFFFLFLTLFFCYSLFIPSLSFQG